MRINTTETRRHLRRILSEEAIGGVPHVAHRHRRSSMAKNLLQPYERRATKQPVYGERMPEVVNGHVIKFRHLASPFENTIG